ncbi:MAG: trimeric intracellular cation channel family protein [Thermomicrobiales bacterium]
MRSAKMRRMDASFHLPSFVDYSATLIWAMTGALLAARRGYDIAGIAALALVTSTGGGLLRDGLFLNNGAPALLRSSTFFVLIGIATLIVVLFGRFVVKWRFFDTMIVLADGIGIGAYALVGMQLSRAAGLGVEPAIFVGIVNAVGGGVLRDVLIRREPDIFRPGVPTALAALFGCLAFIALTRGLDLRDAVAAWIAIGAVLTLRVLALRFDLRTRSIMGLSEEAVP